MPLLFQSLYHFFFLLRRHTPEYTVLLYCPLDFFLCFQCRGIYITIRIFQTGTSGNCCNCHRIITGDHLQINLLAVKKLQCIRSFLTDHICKKQKCNRLKSFRNFCSLRSFRTVCQNQYTKTFFRIFLCIFCKLFLFIRKQELGSSHQICSFLFKNSAAVFSVRRKRNGMMAVHGCLGRKTLSEGIGCGILIPQYTHHAAHNALDLFDICLFLFQNSLLRYSLRLFPAFCFGFFRIFFTVVLFFFSVIGVLLHQASGKRLHTFHAHGSFCNGTCLVQTKRIHSCQCLNAVKLLHQCFPVCENQFPQCQSHTGKKHKTFRNHSQDTGHHTYNRVTEAVSHHIILLIKQQRAQRNNDNTDHLQNCIQGISQFRIMPFKLFGLTGDLGCIIVLSYMDNLTAGFSRCYKASGKQLIPRIFRKVIRLSGKQ